MQGAQDAERVAERARSGGAEHDGDAAAVVGVGDLRRGVGHAQALGVGLDHRLHQVELLQGRADGTVPGEPLGQVQRPEQGAHMPFPHPRHIRVHGALAQLQVEPGQVAQRPGQTAVAVGDGVAGEEGVGPLQRVGTGLRVGIGFRGGLSGVQWQRLGLRPDSRPVQLAHLSGRVQFVLQVCHDGAPLGGR